MDRGLVVPLSPNEEIALRRVAHGSVDVSARHADRLIRLALITADNAGLRLTEIGRRRLRELAGNAIDQSPSAEGSSPSVWMPLVNAAEAQFDRRDWLDQARRKLLAVRKSLAVQRKQP
jgi:hypothetical protein